MSNNFVYISDRVEILARLLNSRREAEMSRLDSEVWNFQHNYLVSKISYGTEHSWCPDVLALILNYLNIRAATFLGVFNGKNCEAMCRLFDRFAGGNLVADDTIILHYLICADLESRKGHLHEAIALYDMVIARTNHGYFKAKALFRKGSIETSEANKGLPFLQINTLSEALGEAERCNNGYMVAEIYRDMSNMFHRTHPSLAMSLLWKSVVYFEKLGFVTEGRRCRLTMAMVYIDMLMHYAGKIKDDKHIKFKEAAEKIVDGIKPDMFASQYDKAHYYYVYAYVKGDEKDMEKAFEYAMDCDVAPQAFDCAIAVAEKSFVTDKSKSMEMLQKAWSIARRMGDRNKTIWVEEGIKRLEYELEREKG